jgi:hypothetical protein
MRESKTKNPGSSRPELREKYGLAMERDYLASINPALFIFEKINEAEFIHLRQGSFEMLWR